MSFLSWDELLMHVGDPVYWDALHVLVLAWGGAYGIGLAIRRCHLADKARRQDQFRLAAELLDMEKTSYATRVAGAVLMGQVANGDQATYREPTIRAFMAWLAHPPVFPKGHRYEYITDYNSADTVVIVKWLNDQKLKTDEMRMLPDFSPFCILDHTGEVDRNWTHPHYMRWRDEKIDDHYSASIPPNS